MQPTKEAVVLFSNTLWFLQTFKSDLIKKLSSEYNVYLLYLGEGPPSVLRGIDEGSVEKVRLLSGSSIKLIPLMRDKRNKILAFTIMPILMTPFLFPLKGKAIATIEGLGRVFVSQRPRYRLLKQVTRVFYRYIFRSYYNRVCVLNHSDMNYLVQNRICGADTIRYIPGTGVDTRVFRAGLRVTKNEQDRVVVAFIGRLNPEKGIYTYSSLADIFKELYPEFKREIEFRVITPGQAIEKMSAEMRRYYATCGVELRPYSSDQTWAYKDIDVLIQPTQYGEGLSRVLLEAASMKIPIITTDNSGTRELLAGPQYGYVLKNPSDVVELAGLLFELLSDIQEAERKSARLYERLNKMFTLENSSEKVVRLIRE